MGLLIFLGLVAMLAMALQTPYGRRVVATMVLIVVLLGAGMYTLLALSADAQRRERYAEASE